MSSHRKVGMVGMIIAASMTVIASGGLSPIRAAVSPLAASVCLTQFSPDELDDLFSTEPGGVIGADYQRATPLANGDVLWTFQDAEVRLPNGSSTLVHNIGMLQRENCFTVLMSGTAADPQPWLLASDTTKFSHWYWPLGAEMAVDGRVYVFLAEMFETGPGYLTHVEPIATRVVGVDIETMEVEFVGLPPDASAALYGWSIESDRTWTYLYAQCHRQFGYDPYIWVYAHDFGCANRVTVARVPRGQLFARPSYWSGARWQSDPGRAAPVIDTVGRLVNASQIVWSNNNWMSITKVGDWWGDRILIERSDRPTGPFVVVADIAAVPKCAVDCNTYFASWVPSPDPDQLIFGLSHNRWDGIATEVYRPTFSAVPAPAYTMSPADRCSIGQCS